MTEGQTYRLRYVGERFDGAKLPIEVLSDLMALRDLIAALAKHEFRQQHPGRQRVPQGFDRAISFSLTDVSDGSAVPVLELDSDAAQRSLPNIGGQMDEMVSRAYDKAASIIDDAKYDRFPTALHADAIRALAKLGANLQGNETMEFANAFGRDGKVVSLNVVRRKALLTHVRETYTLEIENIGTLTGIDASHNNIQVRTEQFGEVRFPLDGAELRAASFDGNIGQPVEFSITVELDANDDLKGVVAVHNVDIINPYDEAISRCIRRLHKLSEFDKGWLDGDNGERVGHLSATRAMHLIFAKADFARHFRIFPTEEGGISVEFDLKERNFAVEIAPDGCLEFDWRTAEGDSGLKEFPSLNSEFLEFFDDITKLEGP